MRTGIHKILVEADVADAPLVATLRAQLPMAEVEVVERVADSGETRRDVLEVVDFRGRFLKPCPGTRHYLCCGYRILHFGVQCTLDCTYCILQAYLNQPNLRIFGNTGDLFHELSLELQTHPDRLYRIGTGEFTDSLLLDPWTRFSRNLVPFFAGQQNAIVELKTKTAHVHNLEGLDHGGHTLVAWSLNSPTVRACEEAGAPSIAQRLDAARLCQEWGYPLAFHFDPMIDHPHWRRGYKETLDRLFDAVDPGRLVWISLGAFRYMPSLKPIIRTRHPGSRILSGEFIRGPDDKMRYFRDIRVELYGFMAEYVRSIDRDLCVYLCMEGEDIWREALGFSPMDKGGLPSMVDRAVQDRMGVGRHLHIPTTDSGAEDGKASGKRAF